MASINKFDRSCQTLGEDKWLSKIGYVGSDRTSQVANVVNTHHTDFQYMVDKYMINILTNLARLIRTSVLLVQALRSFSLDSRQTGSDASDRKYRFRDSALHSSPSWLDWVGGGRGWVPSILAAGPVLLALGWSVVVSGACRPVENWPDGFHVYLSYPGL